jgi:hypothetical protein
MMSEPPPAALTLKRQVSATGVLIAALEHAWHAITARHPDLPAAQIIVGQGSSRGGRGGLLLGHLAADRWQAVTRDGERVHELLIAGEGLAQGAEEVFTTVLHEAAHALALARQIADTSRDGRYHNQHYKTLAEELGLVVQRDRQLGWSTTTLPAATRARYAPVIAQIAAAITSHRLHEPATASARNLRAALCGCPRRIRVAPGTLAAGQIMCALCDQPFAMPAALGEGGAL